MLYIEKLLLHLLQLLANRMYKLIFTAYQREGDGDVRVSFTTTSMRTLSEKCELGYDNLVRVFTRERRVYFEKDGWHIIRSSLHYPIKNRGRGASLNSNRHGT